jgi:hypothetical protein
MSAPIPARDPRINPKAGDVITSANRSMSWRVIAAIDEAVIYVEGISGIVRTVELSAWRSDARSMAIANVEMRS